MKGARNTSPRTAVETATMRTAGSGWVWTRLAAFPSLGHCSSSGSSRLLMVMVLFVLAFLLPEVRGQWMYQLSCETDHKIGGVALANCSGLEYSHVPEDLHTNLDALDMSNNALGVLRNQSFRRYRNLVELYLRNCSLTIIQPDAFKSLNLRKLDLSFNSLNRIPEAALARQVSLTHLYLNGNGIARLGNVTLHNLRNLVELHLQNNRIHELDPGSLWGLFSLRRLSLQHNALLSLDSRTLQYCRHSLAELRLYDNPWHCDCNLHWLREWLSNTTMAWRFPDEGGEPRCDRPSLLKGRPFADVPLEEFACPVQMLTSGSRFSVPRGESIALYCKFFAVPATDAVWSKDGKEVDFAADPGKYVLAESGTTTRISILNVTKFQEKDMGDYMCSASNLRGDHAITYTLRLTGYVEPVPTPAPSSQMSQTDIIILVCVLVGLVVLVVVVFFIVRGIRTWVSRRRRRKEEIRLKVKDHLYSTAEMSPSEKPPPSDDGLDVSQPSRSDTPEKLRSLDEPDSELQGLYESSNGGLQGLPQPHSPGNGGNTYVSFGSELTEPEDLGFGTYSSRQDGSVAESTTPLLPDYYNHTMDSDMDPYDSRANSVIYAPQHRGGGVSYWTGVHLPQTPGSVRSTMTYQGRPDVRDYFDPRYYPTYNGRDYRDYADYAHHNGRDYPEYYQDYQHPYTSPPGRRLVPAKKSASVGNLRQAPPPRKPPRIFHSRELVEGEPEPGKAPTPASVYETITPGTPV